MNHTLIADFGKLPPQSTDVEESIIGILLVSPDAINEVASDLTPEMFYKSAHQVIYREIIETFKTFNNVDIVTVSERLRASGSLESVGGPVFLAQMTNRVVSNANVNTYALIVKEKYLLREYIRVCTEVINLSYNGDLDATSETAETGLLSIAGQIHSKMPIQLGKLINNVLTTIQKVQAHEIKLVGLPTGFVEFDRLTGGMKDSELVILAGRPSMGKSATALQIAINTAELGNPVALFSLEMSDESIAQRSISGVSDKTNVELMQGHCNMDDLVVCTEKLINLPVFVDDTSGLSLLELRAKSRRLILMHGIKLIIVDYLQLMKGEGQSREQEVAFISRGLKAIAKDLNVPVLALSQLSRKSEDRADKRPQLSDLRESGAIEQDADMVMFCYRASVYGLRSVVIDGTEVDSGGVMEMMLAKNRNGAIGSFFLSHNKALSKLEDYDNKIPY
jgi:replicative DNA helicase